LKYLGVDFASNWSWSDTKKRFAKKARSRLAFLSKAIFDGIASDAVENLWRTIVRPTLEYGCEIWGGGKWLEARRKQKESSLESAGRQLEKLSEVNSDGGLCEVAGTCVV